MILVMLLFGCSPEHFNLELVNNNIYTCFAMKAEGDCSEEAIYTFPSNRIIFY